MKLRVVKEAEAAKNTSIVRKPKIRVLLVDDHPILRKGLAQLINLEPDMMVCGEAEDSLYAERALRAGSLGYIMKEEAIEQVLVAIRRVLAGEIFLSDKMKAKMLQQLASGRGKVITSPIEQLTDRELEVFRLIGEGRSTRQIAGELHLSVRTVEAYREYIKGKLNLKNSTELVLHAFHWVHHEAAA